MGFKFSYVLLLCIIVIGSVSAAEFDNVKSYNEELKVVTITNAFGLGDVIGQAKLTTPLNVRVGAGYQKVAQFDIWAYDDYNDAIKQFTFTDMNKKEKVNREFDLKMLSYETIIVDNYYEICDEELIKDITNTNACVKIQNGTHEEIREVWTKVTPADLRKNDLVTIGIFTDVKIGDYVDWIPTIYGVEVEEWATWTQALDANLVAYYTFDSDATDSLGNHDGTITDAPTSIAGKVGNAYSFDGTNDKITVSDHTDFDFGTGDFAFNMWIKGSGNLFPFSTQQGASGYEGTNVEVHSTGIYGKFSSGSGSSMTSTDYTSASWQMLTFQRSGTSATVWIDGSQVGSFTTSANLDSTADLTFAWLSYGSYYSIDIDEVAIWKGRALTTDEITQLYNGGDGIQYSVGVPPEIILISPVNNSDLTSSNVDFIFNVTDDMNVVNTTLFIDGIAETTSTSGVNGTYTFPEVVNEGYHNWSVLAYDNNSLSTQSNTSFFNITILAPVITLYSPEDNFKATTLNNDFIGNVWDDQAIQNVSLLIGGSVVETNTSGLNNSNYTFNYVFGADGTYNWAFKSCDNASDCSTQTRTILIDTTKPFINVINPQDTTYGEVGINLTLNWTALDNNLDSCWYQFKGVNNSVSCTDNGTIITADAYEDSYIYFWANDTFGNENVTYWSWDYITFLNDVGYNSIAYETDTEIISLNISYDISTLAVAATLEYDGTNYSSIKSVGAYGAYFYRSFDIPIGADGENKSLRWHIDVTEGYTGSSSTVTQYQTIEAIYLGDCNVNYTIQGANFTFYDEDSGALVNTSQHPATFEGTFNYWVGSGSTFKNYSISSFNQTNSSYAICISPYNSTTATIKTDLDLSFGANGYFDNSHYLRNASLTNNTNFINLWLLPTSVGQKFFITSYYGIDALEDATITATKYFEGEGVYKTTGISLTDSSGKFAQYLDTDKAYIFTAVKDGEYLGAVSKGAFCEAAPCEMTLQFIEDASDLMGGFSGAFAANVEGDLYYNTTDKLVYAIFTDTTGTANYFRLDVSRVNLNSTSINVCDTTLYTTAGAITCNMSGLNGNYQAELLISRSPEKIVDIIQFVIGGLQDALGTTGLIISLIFLIVIVFSGFKNPVIAVALVPLALVMLKLMDLLPISWLWIGGTCVIAVLLIGRMKT